jgi:hypothetical protein
LEERRRSLAKDLRITERTVRLREDAVIARAASQLVHLANTKPNKATGDESADSILHSSESPFAKHFHLENLTWDTLSVEIDIRQDRSLEVYEQHVVVATKDRVDRVGMIVCPNFFGVGNPEIQMIEFGTHFFPDTLTEMSDSVAIRTAILESPSSAGTKFVFCRAFCLPSNSNCYTVSSYCRFGKFRIMLRARDIFNNEDGEPVDDRPWLDFWVIPGVPTSLAPDLIASLPPGSGDSIKPTVAFNPQHYCWTRYCDDNYNLEVIFESLIPGFTYGIAWTLREDVTDEGYETPRPQDTEDGDGVPDEPS